MPRPPDRERGPGRHTEAPRPADTTAERVAAILPDRGDEHCPRCACRCRCHRPPPEPPCVLVPPEPGSPFYCAWLAEVRVA